MSAITDFSFNNPLISKYFLGSDDYVPVAEFMYINSHPLIQPNFISQIEVIINETSEYLSRKNMKGGPVSKFVHLAQRLGAVLPAHTEKQAAEALKVLRELYSLCKQITG